MARTYYFDYVSVQGRFKNSFVEGQVLGHELSECVTKVLHSYGCGFLVDDRINGLKHKLYNKNEIYHGKGAPDPDAYQSSNIDVSITRDNKIYIYFGRDPFVEENQNDEIINDIRTELVGLGIIDEDAVAHQSDKIYYYNAKTDKPSGGCYVATAVYGSYDCPQVWTLRRWRDYSLAQSRLGRAFIRCYYAVSPTLVKWFGEAAWFKKALRGRLDAMVQSLQEEGYASLPYDDKMW